MKRAHLLFLLAATFTSAAACEPAAPTVQDESDPQETSAPADTGAPAPDVDEPTADVEASPPATPQRPPLCTPPDLAQAPAKKPPMEPQIFPMSAEDTGEYDVEVVDHPAVIDADLGVSPAALDHELIGRQQRYLDAWRAAEASQRFASDEDRDAARAALKQQIIGE